MDTYNTIKELASNFEKQALLKIKDELGIEAGRVVLQHFKTKTNHPHPYFTFNQCLNERNICRKNIEFAERLAKIMAWLVAENLYLKMSKSEEVNEKA